MTAVETMDKIKRQIANNDVLVYMKGTPIFPMCGFSSQVVRILDELNTHYAYVNILENPDIRAELPKFANWPTFPQLYVKGELIGGCDIITDMHKQDTLKPVLEKVNGVADSPESVIAVE